MWLRESVVESDGGERMMEEGKGGRERRGREGEEREGEEREGVVGSGGRGREWWAVREGGLSGGQ